MLRIVVIVMSVLVYFSSVYAVSTSDVAEMLRTGEYEKADDALKSNSDLPNEYSFTLDLDLGRYEDGFNKVQELLKTGNTPELLVWKGRFATRIGKRDVAKEAFEKALELDKNNYLAQYFLAQNLYARGDDACDDLWDKFIDIYNEEDLNLDNLILVGRACVEIDLYKDALKAYDEANSKDKKAISPYYYMGSLFAMKHQYADAKNEFEKLLAINPNYADAHVGLAEVFLSKSEYSKADKHATVALKVNPNHIGAMYLLAYLDVTDNDFHSAHKRLEVALKVNPQDLEVLSFLAALHYVQRDMPKYEEVSKKVLGLNPKYGEFYRIVASAAQNKRRFRDELDLLKKAFSVDPTNNATMTQMGLTLMRLGREREARPYLEASFEDDSFNALTFNMLNLLDKLDEFPKRKTENFLVKIDPRDDELLGALFENAVENAWDKYTKLFDYKPLSPVVFEVFSKHDDFSARTIGMPGLGALGVCFGEVFLMNSPRIGVDHGSLFNWRCVLEHEFLHVITLQKSNYATTRWLTEGISVYYENDQMLSWDVLMKRAEFDGALLNLSDIESAFTRPEKTYHVQVAYYTATLWVAHIYEKYGHKAIDDMLKEFAKQKTMGEVIGAVFDKDIKTFSAELDAVVQKRLSEIPVAPPLSEKADAKRIDEWIEKEPMSVKAHIMRTRLLLSIPQLEGAMHSARYIMKLDDKSPTAHSLLGIAQLMAERTEKAKASFEAAIDLSETDFVANYYLGEMAMKQSDAQVAIKYLEAAKKSYPRYTKDGGIYKLLAKAYLSVGNTDMQRLTWKDWMDIDIHALEPARKLGMSYSAVGKSKEALFPLLRARDINPLDAEVQFSLGRVLLENERLEESANALNSAVLLDEKMIEGWYLLGLVRGIAKDVEGAKECYKKALDINPNHSNSIKALKEISVLKKGD